MSPVADVHGAFAHEAFLYSGAAEYLAVTVPFVREGLSRGEPVLVGVPGPNLALIGRELAGDAARVRLFDIEPAARNPGRLVGALQQFLEEHPAGRVRVIGEPLWPGRSPAERLACVQHEALVNIAFADRPARFLCPYDAAGLDADSVAAAVRTHPALLGRYGSRRSPAYADPGRVARECNVALPDPPLDAATLIFQAPSGPRHARRLVHEVATEAGMGAARVDELRVAVNEVVTNTVLHTGRPGILSIWREDREIVCEVQDSGHLTDLLVGRLRPDPRAGAGRGLFLVHQLCDLVRVHTHPGGTTVQMRMRLR
ncbi:MAG: anti-sigma factor RsbA family regulatory protein [Pseudonocardia sp.]